MIDENEESENDGIRLAYCAACRDVVSVDEDGCTECRDEGSISRAEPVIRENVPPSSPRVNECPTCGADPGEFCYPSREDDGTGHNHESRVELVEQPEEFTVRVLGEPDRTIQTAPLYRGRR